jgi:hypothetical protein
MVLGLDALMALVALTRRNLTLEESDAFWAWAAIEPFRAQAFGWGNAVA